MILGHLSRHAREVGLIDDMAVKRRPAHLILRIDADGHPLKHQPWEVLTREVEHPKKPGKLKTENSQLVLLPEYPGVSAGGKAYFLADVAEKVLGIFAKTGEVIPADAKNASKAFQHYWSRIAEAFQATDDAELGAMLRFREQYLLVDDRRAALAALVGVEPVGKEGKPTFSALTSGGPVPLENKTVIFQVGATSLPVFAEGSPLRDYWRDQFRRERFADAPTGSTANVGVCLVTGEDNVPIAEVHRTLIKGVPGLPPIGGYVVSFGDESPSLSSYGFEKGWNAPVSEDAAVAYALGLNHLLANPNTRRKHGNSVMCAWVDLDLDATRAILQGLENPPARDVIPKFFERFHSGQSAHVLQAAHYRSLTLAANGGRVVVRRWIDVPLPEVITALQRWFEDLETDVIEIPRTSGDNGRKKKGRATNDAGPTDMGGDPKSKFNPFSIFGLATATARVSSEIRETTYDALYRSALDPHRFVPATLLPPVLDRLRIAAATRGGGVRFDTQRFALIKLILRRSGDSNMEPKRELSQTNDRAYNCGRLLAVLDDLQRAAQGQVGADIVSRFYGAASTYPANVFGRLMDLATVHEKKLKKSSNPRLRGAGWALMGRVREIVALIQPESGSDAPDFPSMLTLPQQGRFALGFHQQKAADDRALRKYLAEKAAGKKAEDSALDALAAIQDAPTITD